MFPSAAQQSLRGDRYPHEQFGSIPRIDQRDPDYQRAYEHLSRANQLIARAIREVAQARELYRMPGFRYDYFVADLRYINNQLAPVLMPERRRLEYETLTPSGDYFVPDAPALPGPSN